MYCISSIKKQIGISAFAAASPKEVNTSVRLCVRLFVLYKSFSSSDKENVLSFESKDTTKDLIASNGFFIKFLNFSLTLICLKNACEQVAICEIKSFRSATSICLQKIFFSSAISFFS